MAKGKNVDFMIVLVFLLLAAGYLLYQKYGIPLQIADKTVVFLYDTDPQNNAYIKGDLTAAQLKVLDVLLEKERKDSGLRLLNKKIHKISHNDQAIYDAYMRWRRCKEMMRSKHRTVYPAERSHYKKK